MLYMLIGNEYIIDVFIVIYSCTNCIKLFLLFLNNNLKIQLQNST